MVETSIQKQMNIGLNSELHKAAQHLQIIYTCAWSMHAHEHNTTQV